MPKRPRDWDDDNREENDANMDDNNQGNKDVEDDSDTEDSVGGPPTKPCPLCKTKGVCKRKRKMFFGIIDGTETLDCPLCDGKKYFYVRPRLCVFNSCISGIVSRDKDVYGKEKEVIKCPLCRGLQYTLDEYCRCPGCDGTGRTTKDIEHWFWTKKVISVCRTCNGLGAFQKRKTGITTDKVNADNTLPKNNTTPIHRAASSSSLSSEVKSSHSKDKKDSNVLNSSLTTYALGAVTGLAVGCAFSPELILPTVFGGAALVMATKDEISKKLFPTDNTDG